MLNAPDAEEDRKRRQETERLAVAARLKEVIGPLPGQTSQARVAAICDVKPQAITGWLKTGRIAKRHFPVIAKEAKCSLAWLMTGDGPKNLSKDQTIARYPEAPPARPHNIGALLDAASPRSRSALERIAAAAEAGRLTEADMELLHRIAERIAAKE